MHTLLTALIVFAPSLLAAQESKQDLAMSHLRAGQEQLHAEHWAEAEVEFKEAIRFDPLLDLAHYGLGQAYMGAQRFDDAVRAYTECRQVYLKNQTDRLADNVEAEHRLEDSIRSLRDYRRSLETGQNRTSNTTATMNRLDSQIGQLEAQRRRDPNAKPQVAPFISTALGSAYFRTGALADAEREWLTALAVDPKIGEVHNNLAVVCLMSGRITEAAEHVKRAEKAGVRVNPQLKKDIESQRQ